MLTGDDDRTAARSPPRWNRGGTGAGPPAGQRCPPLEAPGGGLRGGAGTDIAIESSDIVLVGERLEAVPEAREIAVASHGKSKQNLTIACIFNGIGVPAAITGFVQPVWAMVAMISSVSLVLASSFGARLRPALLFALPALARRGLGTLAPSSGSRACAPWATGGSWKSSRWWSPPSPSASSGSSGAASSRRG